MECKEAEDLLPAYVLNALTPEERGQVEAHLAACPWCSALLREHLQVVADLALVVEPVQPPSRLKARLMKQVGRSARGREGVKKLVPSFASVALAGASLAVLLVAGVLAFTLRTSGQVDQLREDNSSLYRQVVQLQSDNAALAQRVVFLSAGLDSMGQDTSRMAVYVAQMAEDDSKLMNVVRMQRSMTYMLASPETQVFYLGRQQGRPSGEGMLMLNSHMGAALLVAAGLQPLAPDQVYQVWLQKGSETISGGRLTVDESGWGMVILRPKESMGAFHWIGVTVEPVEGGIAPSGTLVLAGPMTR